MKLYIILRMIIALLSTDPGGSVLATKHQDHLKNVAQAVFEVARDKQASESEVRMLIAIAMRESRFGIPYKAYFPASRAGACGVWQVKPILFDRGTGTTHNESCEDMRDLYYNASRGLEHIRYWLRQKRRICHYNGGWKCKLGARQYERKVKWYMKQIRPEYLAQR
jgi:hypothetical protein